MNPMPRLRAGLSSQVHNLSHRFTVCWTYFCSAAVVVGVRWPNHRRRFKILPSLCETLGSRET